MFKYTRKKKQDEGQQHLDMDNIEDHPTAPPIPPPKDNIIPLVAPKSVTTEPETVTTNDNDTYKPLDEINLPSDFRTSLILTQFNNDPPTDLTVPTTTTTTTTNNEERPSSALSALPMPSMPWMTNSTDSTRPPLGNNNTNGNTTPPLSPTLSSTSESLARKSSSTRSSNEPWRPPLLLGGGGKQLNKGDDFQDIASGPPIIPRSKTPPPALPAIMHPMMDREKSKNIFDSDDDESDTDLFFQDFSANRPKSRRISRKIIQKAKNGDRLSKFDLSAFANHLHDNRLSVMQLRQSNIHLTKEDEKELEQLLEKRKSMAHGDLDMLDEHQDTSFKTDTLVPPMPHRPVSKKPSLLLQKLKKGNNTTKEHDVMPTPSTSGSRSQEQLAERKRRVRKSMSMDEIHRIAAIQDEKTQVSEVPTVPSIQEDTSSSDMNSLAPSTSTPSLAKWSLHKSASTSNKKSFSNDSLLNSATVGTNNGTGEKSSRTQSAKPAGQRSIGLFGSLRQASRSHQPFRGLVRNLSSAGSYYRARHSSANGTAETGGMSRAAMAVMEHDKSKLSDNTTTPSTKTTSSDTKNTTTLNNNDDRSASAATTVTKTSPLPLSTSSTTTPTNSKEDTSSEGGNHSGGNLLTQLLAKASKAKRTPTTKTVNMNHGNNHPTHKSSNNNNSQQRREKTKSRVVRRTIIYVPPDSLNFMKTLQQRDDHENTSAGLRKNKNGPAPPLPTDMVERMRQLQKSSKATTAVVSPRHSEDDHSNKANRSTISSSSTSSKTRHGDDNDSSSSPATTIANKEDDEDDDFGSVLNYYDDESLYDYYQHRDSIAAAGPQLEGLELREMEDGTVEWGIVKKQGNRKSFYVRDERRVEEEVEEEDEEKIEEQVLKMMGLSVSQNNHNAYHHYNTNNKHSIMSTMTTSTMGSTTPPPVPRRSPRRRIDSAEQQMQQQQQQQQQIDNRRAKHISTIHSRKDASTTDYYFAPQSTLPSLLQMIADSAQEEEQQAKRKKQASVEEQLDEMMRSFQPPVESTQF
ncbi:hypothetical protein BDA99DRAFT_503690 [Phascolomyces articulosus]|uniref:Uncharacterized protein n=1 Tax=Phascolomyces articulosus TaxID=60185 RepID=A0AAD5KEK8_9FUNG|nr:hypothetical protein BDA99DRAFT_503690 [Phascolomyces articulosus]